MTRGTPVDNYNLKTAAIAAHDASYVLYRTGILSSGYTTDASDVNFYNLTLNNKLHVKGDFHVDGSMTEIYSSRLDISDGLIELATSNPSDTIDIGFYGRYDLGGDDVRYAGLYREKSDGDFKLFKNLAARPNQIGVVPDTSYAIAKLHADVSATILDATTATIETVNLTTANITSKLNMEANGSSSNFLENASNTFTISSSQKPRNFISFTTNPHVNSLNELSNNMVINAHSHIFLRCEGKGQYNNKGVLATETSRVILQHMNDRTTIPTNNYDGLGRVLIVNKDNTAGRLEFGGTTRGTIESYDPSGEFKVSCVSGNIVLDASINDVVCHSRLVSSDIHFPSVVAGHYGYLKVDGHYLTLGTSKGNYIKLTSTGTMNNNPKDNMIVRASNHMYITTSGGNLTLEAAHHMIGESQSITLQHKQSTGTGLRCVLIKNELDTAGRLEFGGTTHGIIESYDPSGEFKVSCVSGNIVLDASINDVVCNSRLVSSDIHFPVPSTTKDGYLKVDGDYLTLGTTKGNYIKLGSNQHINGNQTNMIIEALNHLYINTGSGYLTLGSNYGIINESQSITLQHKQSTGAGLRCVLIKNQHDTAGRLEFGGTTHGIIESYDPSGEFKVSCVSGNIVLDASINNIICNSTLIASDISINAMNVSALSIAGDLNIPGNGSIDGALVVTQDASFNSTLDVTGDTTLGKLTVTGGLYFGSAFGSAMYVQSGTGEIKCKKFTVTHNGVTSEAGDIEAKGNAIYGGGNIYALGDGNTGESSQGNSKGNMYAQTDISAGRNIYAHGDITAFYGQSDRRLKKNVETIDDALSIINNLRGVRFDWNEEAQKLNKNVDLNKRELGVIAQEFEKELPEVIKDGLEGYMAVRYEKITPLLIQCIKEQQMMIKQQDERISKLENSQN